MKQIFRKTGLLYFCLTLCLSIYAQDINRQEFTIETSNSIAFNGLDFPVFYSKNGEIVNSVELFIGNTKNTCKFTSTEDGKTKIRTEHFIPNPNNAISLTIAYTVSGEDYKQKFLVKYVPSVLHSLMVGNNTPFDRNLDTLKTAENNVDSLYNFISRAEPIDRYSSLGFRSVLKGKQSIIGKEASTDNINKALSAIQQSVEGGGFNDCVILFFSGHGKITDNGAFGYEATDGIVLMDSVITAIEPMLARGAEVTFIVDACYSGLITNSLSKIDVKDKVLKCVFSCSDNEISIESDSENNSAFIKSLLSSLRQSYIIPVMKQIKSGQNTQTPMVYDFASYMKKGGENNCVPLFTDVGMVDIGGPSREPIIQAYSESWLPFSRTSKGKGFSIGETSGERAAFISETVFLVGAIGFGTSAQIMWNKAKSSKTQYQYTEDYVKTGRVLTGGFVVSCVGVVGSYFWHHLAVKKRIKSHNYSNSQISNQLMVSIYPNVGMDYATIGAAISF